MKRIKKDELPQELNAETIKILVEMALEFPKTTFDWNKIADEFWETVNKPWLDDAIMRGDNFRLVSSPTNARAIYVTDDLRNFVLDANGNKIKSIFGREITHLQTKGYTILSNGTAVKL